MNKGERLVKISAISKKVDVKYFSSPCTCNCEGRLGFILMVEWLHVTYRIVVFSLLRDFGRILYMEACCEPKQVQCSNGPPVLRLTSQTSQK